MKTQTGYEYEVGEVTDPLAVLTGKESVKVDHNIVIPLKTILVMSGVAIVSAVIYRVLS